ncbi:MAG: hypothetical protein U0L49_05095 [Eubacterium sp.]|nr:hypothetical protein [Eubacterium sp.]
MITVKYIGEADYGCEEQPENASEMCLAVLEKNGEVIRLELPGTKVDSMGLKEGMELSEEQMQDLEK